MDKSINEAFLAVTAAADRLTMLVEARTAEDRRLIIDSRRDLSRAVFDLGRAVEKIAKEGGWVNDELYRKFRVFFNDARQSIALHQAEWPVSGIGRDENAYVISSRQAREAKDRLVDFVRKNLLDGGVI